MREKKYIRVKAMCAALTFFLGLVVFPVAASAAVGSIVAVNGQVSILRGGQLPAVMATVGTEVNVGDFVRTKSASGCEIRFSDGNVIKVGPRSRIDISVYAIDRDTRTIGLARGKVEAVVVPPAMRDTKVQPKRFEIHSPNAVAGIRGTDLLVFYEGGTTGILVISLHGGDNVYAYSLSNPDQLIDLPAGFITYIRDNQLPTPGRQATEAEINALIRELLARMGIEPDALLGGLDGANGLTDVPVSDSFPQLLQPLYEVGRVDMSVTSAWVGNGSMDATMTASFLAPTVGGDATKWVTNDFAATWTSEGSLNPVGSGSFIMDGFSGPNGQASASFTFTTFDEVSGQWSAKVDYGDYYPAAGGYSWMDGGGLSGSGATDYWMGSLSGGGGGAVIPTLGEVTAK